MAGAGAGRVPAAADANEPTSSRRSSTSVWHPSRTGRPRRRPPTWHPSLMQLASTACFSTSSATRLRHWTRLPLSTSLSKAVTGTTHSHSTCDCWWAALQTSTACLRRAASQRRRTARRTRSCRWLAQVRLSPPSSASCDWRLRHCGAESQAEA